MLKTQFYGADNGFLGMTTKVQASEEKINKLYFIKIKNLLTIIYCKNFCKCHSVPPAQQQFFKKLKTCARF
jgi:hypothetical protein